MTEWIISGNPDIYGVINAFRDLKMIDWEQSVNVIPGDIVYIYVSGDIKARFSCPNFQTYLNYQAHGKAR